MHHEINAAPPRLEVLEHRVDGADLLNVTGQENV